jgi:hypothetical protein
VQLAINYLDDAGKWHWPETSIARAVEDERQRPWPQQEASDFVRIVNVLAVEMGPEWEPELRDIAALAVTLAAPRTTGVQVSPGVAAAATAFPTSTHQAVTRSHQSDSAPGQKPAPSTPPPIQGRQRPGESR